MIDRRWLELINNDSDEYRNFKGRSWSTSSLGSFAYLIVSFLEDLYPLACSLAEFCLWTVQVKHPWPFLLSLSLLPYSLAITSHNLIMSSTQDVKMEDAESKPNIDPTFNPAPSSSTTENVKPKIETESKPETASSSSNIVKEDGTKPDVNKNAPGQNQNQATPFSARRTASRPEHKQDPVIVAEKLEGKSEEEVEAIKSKVVKQSECRRSCCC